MGRAPVRDLVRLMNGGVVHEECPFVSWVLLLDELERLLDGSVVEGAVLTVHVDFAEPSRDEATDGDVVR